MKKNQAVEQQEINALLRQALSEGDYSPLTEQDSLEVRQAIKDTNRNNIKPPG